MALPSVSLSVSPESNGHRAIVPPPVVNLIGNTPLIELRAVTNTLPPSVRVFGKAEWKNPGGSVKDRAAWFMFLDLMQQKDWDKKRVLDATSGNTGIALAMLGAAFGVGVTLCVPENASVERKIMLKAYGAEIIYTDPLQNTDGARAAARELVEKYPEQYHYVNQYANPANVRAHVTTTGPEIWRQTGGRITHFISGLGTTGTFTGIGYFLRNRNPNVKLISFGPDGPMHGLEGLKHMPTTAHIPEIYDSTLAEDNIEVTTDEAYQMVHRLATEEGLLVGVSAAAAAAAAIKLGETLDEGIIVTIFPDAADKYLSLPIWGNET